MCWQYKIENVLNENESTFQQQRQQQHINKNVNQ